MTAGFAQPLVMVERTGIIPAFGSSSLAWAYFLPHGGKMAAWAPSGNRGSSQLPVGVSLARNGSCDHFCQQRMLGMQTLDSTSPASSRAGKGEWRVWSEASMSSHPVGCLPEEIVPLTSQSYRREAGVKGREMLTQYAVWLIYFDILGWQPEMER